MPMSGPSGAAGVGVISEDAHAMTTREVLILLLVATAILGLTMALSTEETGMAEKVVLLGLMGACVYVAARVPRFVGSLEAKLRRS